MSDDLLIEGFIFFFCEFSLQIKIFGSGIFLVNIPQIVVTQIGKLMTFHFLGLRLWFKTVSSR